MESTVGDIMTSAVVCAKADYSIKEILQIMEDEELHCVPILNKEGHCIGSICDADLIRWQKIGKRSTDIVASDILSRPAVTVNPLAAPLEAIKLMVKTKVCHLVVVDKGELIGIVSLLDVLDQFLSDSEQSCEEPHVVS